jgi:dihydroxy-acid dehydratase
LDPDRISGVIRYGKHAFTKDGSLAVLYGNLGVDGAIVKTDVGDQRRAWDGT